MAADRGAQPERTRLAWLRTTLALMVVPFAVGRELLPGDRLAGHVVLVCAAAAVAVAVPARHRYRAVRQSPHLHSSAGAGLLAVSSALTVSGGVAVLAYVLVR